MKLYTYFRSSAAFRVRIALNLKGLAYDTAFVHLPRGEHRAPAYGAVNPQALLPKDPFERARVRSLAMLVACEIHPVNNLRVLQHLKRALGQNEEQVNAWYRHWIGDGLTKFEADLGKAETPGKFCHGNTPTMADCCLVPQIFNAQRYQCDTAAYPATMRVFAECMKIEAFDRAQPAKQPDAE